MKTKRKFIDNDRLIEPMFGVNRSKVLTTLCLVAVVFGIQIERSQSLAFPSGTIREEDYFKLKPKEGKNKLNKEYSNKEVVYGSEDDEDEDSKFNELQEKPVIRSQRIDQRNYKHHSKNENRLRSFHNNRNLQKNYLHKQEHDFNLDYETILDELLRNPDIFEDEMNLKDIGTSIGKNRYEDLDQENMPLEELANRETNSENKKVKTHHLNPVKHFDVKENLLAEKDYNKQFLNEPNIDDLLGLNDDDIFQDLNLNLNQKSPKGHGSESINSNPSLVNKQSNPTLDPTIDSKFDQIKKKNDSLFVFVVAGCTLAGVIGLVAAGVCWYTVYRRSTNDASYVTKSAKLSPSGSLKSNSTSSGDRRLAQSAQMYHYQHQKQQMIAMEKANSEQKQEDSENSDGETEEGDYTVYECPGLAPTGEMEVKNPLFKEEFSSSNISQSAMPPAYSTIESQEAAKNEQLIEIDESKQESDKNSAQPVESVTIQINESNTTSQE
ncbi:Neural proliferation differentiation and control [Brachionus plicatilis]|uniref:Neural proliferation differentiation and control n=1 Tax=Brachionus plicatilis TaxID=10195 RepID=A0A3M7R5D0_BRAPC|nr:Neural proliferation differentiation and control [Brachionus plicatilis]